MGTRADFYVGIDKHAEWLGSIAWDGYWDGIPESILLATNEAAYRDHVATFLASRDDATLPSQGWPWPWDNSGLTDCAYTFYDGRTWQEYGERWYAADREIDYEAEIEKPTSLIATDWPDMRDRKSVTFGPRSGVFIVRG